MLYSDIIDALIISVIFLRYLLVVKLVKDVDEQVVHRQRHGLLSVTNAEGMLATDAAGVDDCWLYLTDP